MRGLKTECMAMLFVALPAFGQYQKPDPPPNTTPHDISLVEPAPLGGTIATPLPEKQRRRLKKYEIPELAGARQALGSQLIDGDLPKPQFDYIVRNQGVEQRISLFEGGLIVVRMTGDHGPMQKKLILPDDALKAYRKEMKIDVLRETVAAEVPPERRAELRIYDPAGIAESIVFDPVGSRSKPLNDAISPIEDLLRAISEDRILTNSITGYEPKAGDVLVGEDRKTWKVERVIADAGIVQLRCTSQPTVIYVAKKELYQYFVGKPETAQ